ncbi:hypothetical protein Hanom_Chr16g01462821 [Helianthus anomalus]
MGRFFTLFFTLDFFKSRFFNAPFFTSRYNAAFFTSRFFCGVFMRHIHAPFYVLRFTKNLRFTLYIKAFYVLR